MFPKVELKSHEVKVEAREGDKLVFGLICDTCKQIFLMEITHLHGTGEGQFACPHCGAVISWDREET